MQSSWWAPASVASWSCSSTSLLVLLDVLVVVVDVVDVEVLDVVVVGVVVVVVGVVVVVVVVVGVVVVVVVVLGVVLVVEVVCTISMESKPGRDRGVPVRGVGFRAPTSGQSGTSMNPPPGPSGAPLKGDGWTTTTSTLSIVS